mgnify:CR=1 FL=1
MDKYLVVVEKSETGYSAYSPDVVGCIATGKTIEKTIANMKTALALHLHNMAEDGEALPTPRGIASYLEAINNSEGEEYFLAHIMMKHVLPELAHA